MHPLRRIALGGLWGAVGPVSVALFVIAVWGDWILQRKSDDLFPLSFAYNLLDLWFLLPIEAAFGMVYGAARVAAPVGETSFNVKLGAAIWGVLGLPIFLVAIPLAALAQGVLVIAVDVELPPGKGSWFMDVLFPLTGIYLAHIGGGAIAGYQVNYFLGATFGRADEGLPL